MGVSENLHRSSIFLIKSRLLAVFVIEDVLFLCMLLGHIMGLAVHYSSSVSFLM